jgi:hypothetical protein
MTKRREGMVECAVCAAYGCDEIDTPATTAVEVEHDPQRDGLEVRTVYACPECAAETGGAS